MRRTAWARPVLSILAGVSLVVGGCGGDDDEGSSSAGGAKGEVVITCEACPVKATDDVFQQYRKSSPRRSTPSTRASTGSTRSRTRRRTTTTRRRTTSARRRPTRCPTSSRSRPRSSATRREVGQAHGLRTGARRRQRLEGHLPARRLPQPDRRRRPRLGAPGAARRRRHLLQQGAVQAGGRERVPRDLGRHAEPTARSSRRAGVDPLRDGRRLGDAAHVVQPDRHPAGGAEFLQSGIRDGDYASNPGVVAGDRVPQADAHGRVREQGRVLG